MPVFRPAIAYMTTPGKKDGHTHTAVVDINGNGATTVDGTNPHDHQIKRGRVLVADGHTHELRGGVYV